MIVSVAFARPSLSSRLLLLTGLAKATDTIKPKQFIWLDRVILTGSNGIHYQLASDAQELKTIVFLPGVSDEWRARKHSKIVTPLGEA